MSHAPSDLSWDEWSRTYLDKDIPVVEGQETKGRASKDGDCIPEFWQTSLEWLHSPDCKLPRNLSGNKLVAADVHGNRVVYSVGGIEVTDDGSRPVDEEGISMGVDNF